MPFDPLDRRVQFRSLQSAGPHAKNKTVKVSIPRDMLVALKWLPDDPIRIELIQDEQGRQRLELTSVKAEEYDLERSGTFGWQFKTVSRKRT